MEVLMSLYKENQNEAIYIFGDSMSERRGVARIDKINPDMSEIVKYPDDGSCSGRIAFKAITKLVSKARNGEYPEKLSYCPGW